MFALVAVALMLGSEAVAEGMPDVVPEGHLARPSAVAPGMLDLAPVEVVPEEETKEEAEEAPQKAEQLQAIADARAMLGRREFAEMRELLAPLMDSDDPDIKWPARFWTARAYHGENNPGAAIKLLGGVRANHEPLACDAEYWLGMARIRERRHRTARGHFKEAHRLAAEGFRPNCLYYIAYTHFVEGSHERAAEVFDEFLRQYPDSGLAVSAQRLLGLAQERLEQARRADFEWVANLGLASASQVLNWGESPEMGLGANVQLGGRLNWVPRDGLRMSARAFGTRTSYVTGKLGDRQGIIAGVTMFQNLGDMRSASYGLNYSRNQRVDIITSDSQTYGISGSYSTPMFSDGRMAVGARLSRLKYYQALSSGHQQTFWLSYSEPLSTSTRLALGLSYTDSNVAADYLSYDGFSYSTTVNRRLSARRSMRSGFTYTTRDFDAPRPHQTVVREDIQRSYFGEYTQRVNRRISVTVGWRETARRSTLASLSRTDPSWYLRTSRLLDLRF